MKFLSQINVNTEYTLPIVDGTNGQVLTTDGSGAVYWGSVSIGALNLDGLQDVVITTPTSGQILRYGIPVGSEDPNPVWYNWSPNYLTPSSSIDNLGDVTITSVTAGQLLQWNGSAWVNATLSTVEYVSKVQHTVKAGVAISKGQAVYITGADGTNMIAGLASNASEATSSKVIGLAVSNAAINDQIFVVTEGLIAGLNTSTATAGDPVWLGTNGNLIFGLLNKPVAPAHLVYIGVVTRVQSNNGEIFVNVQNGFELNEIHDALITSPTAGQLLRRDSDNLWKNWTPNYLTAESDTLATVTARGATTTSNITVNGAAFATSFSATGLLITNADTSGSLQPDQGSPANKIYSFRWAGNEQGYIDTDAKITFAGFKTPTGTASQFLKANGTVDSNVYITSAALSGYATQTWVNSNFYNQGQIDDFFYGNEPILGYNKTNWDAAYNWGNHASAGYATTSYVTTAIANLVDAAPATLDTLNELAAALGDDPNFATTVTNSIATKVPQTRTLTINGTAFDLSANRSWTIDSADGYVSDVRLVESTLSFSGEGNAFSGSVDLSTLPFQPVGSYLTAEADTLASVTGRGASTSTAVTFNGGVNLAADIGIRKAGDNWIIGYSTSLPGVAIGSGTPTDKVSISSGGTQRVWFDTNGNVGIGTANPAYKLHVSGNVYGTTTAQFGQSYIDGTQSGWAIFGSNSVVNGVKVVRDGNVNYNDVVITPSGYIGLGVNPVSGDKVEIAGTLRVHTGNNWDGLQIYADGQNGYIRGLGDEIGLHIRSEYGNVYIADDRGVVGVGGIHTSYKFNVEGAVRLTGSLVFDDLTSNVIQHRAGTDVNTLVTVGHGGFDHNGYLRIGGADVATRAWVQAQGYLTSETDSQTLDWDGANKNLSITNGNTVTLDGLATEEFVTSQGYLTSLPSHNHDDRYYTESESDSRFVNASGDTMNGSLSFDAAAVIKKRITADGFNPVKTATGVLTAMSANSSGNTYYVIESNVPQDEYQMGGFTIEIFGNYYDKNSKTKVDLGGYWSPESNGGFEGFEAHGTNPQYKPTIEVARNNSTGKTAFIIYGVSWSYPIIVARDLWLGYNGTDGGTYGEGWTITGTNDVSSYTNRDTVVWRNAYSDSNPAGYITGYTETDTLATVTARGASTSSLITINSSDVGLKVQENGTSTAWRGRIGSFNSSADKSSFLGNYTGRAGVFGHNNALTAWDDLWVNTLGIYGQGNLYLSWNTYVKGNSNDINYSIWHAGNDGASSGLDADLLDGVDSGSFLRSDADDSFSGTLTMSTQKALVASNYGHGVYGVYDASVYQHVWSMGVSYSLPANGASSGNGGNLYGLAWSYNPDYGYSGSNAQSKPGLNHQLLLMMNGVTHTALGSGIWTNGLITTVNHGTSANWKAAYDWGNHADASYIKADSTEPLTIQAETVTFTGSVTIEGTLTESSSIRFKENITPLGPALDKVNQLEAVSYNKIGVDDREIGLIAEDVAELFPEVVTYNEEGAPMGVQYQRLSVILLKAVQELSQEVNELKKKLN